MREIWLSVIGAVLLVFSVFTLALAETMLVPIDSSLFTWVQPYSGAATWSSNNLTLHISSDPSTGGGAETQTAVLPTSLLPRNITGISFEISPSGALMDFFSFGYLVADGQLAGDPAAQPQGGINLVTSSASDTQPPMSNFMRDVYGLGGGMEAEDHVWESLGAVYSPFSLQAVDRNSLSSYPYFWLDFRASSNDKPLDIMLSNINWIVEYTPIQIDIMPGDDTNSINLTSKKNVTVAILTIADFDASTVDPTTVKFANASPIKRTIMDVDGDGDMDMLLYFNAQALNLDINSTEATLTATTDDLRDIVGTDAVNIVRKGKKK